MGSPSRPRYACASPTPTRRGSPPSNYLVWFEAAGSSPRAFRGWVSAAARRGDRSLVSTPSSVSAPGPLRRLLLVIRRCIGDPRCRFRFEYAVERDGLCSPTAWTGPWHGQRDDAAGLPDARVAAAALTESRRCQVTLPPPAQTRRGRPPARRTRTAAALRGGVVARADEHESSGSPGSWSTRSRRREACRRRRRRGVAPRSTAPASPEKSILRAGQVGGRGRGAARSASVR